MWQVSKEIPFASQAKWHPPESEDDWDLKKRG
jgi:hypothetical protein